MNSYEAQMGILPKR